MNREISLGRLLWFFQAFFQTGRVEDEDKEWLVSSFLLYV